MKLDAFRSVVAAAATGAEPSKEQALEAANEVIAVVESIATSLTRIADALEPRFIEGEAMSITSGQFTPTN